MMQLGKPVVIEAEGQVEAAVIWLHGMMDSPDNWRKRLMVHAREHPSWKWLLLRAPQLPITYLGGKSAAAWGDFKDKSAVKVGGVDHERKDCILPDMVSAVHESIETVHSTDSLPYCRIAVAGFSQGAALAAEAVFKFQHALAGHALLCGWLTPGARTVLIQSPNRHIPVFLSHSQADEDVEFGCAKLLHQSLVDVEAQVEFQVLSDLGHIPTARQMISQAIPFLAAAILGGDGITVSRMAEDVA